MMKTRKKIWFSISFWLVVGAITLMAIVSAVMTFTFVQQKRDQAVELLVEKGSTLIRTFETGMDSTQDIGAEIFRLQKLLVETAQQPDIDYIIITDQSGNIVADGDPAQVGDKYGLDVDIKSLSSSKKITWRQVTNPGGADTFEVYRGFFPFGKDVEEKSSLKDASQSKETNKWMIYIGLNMATIEKATKEDNRAHTIIVLILLLIGSSAIISLYLAQAYRLTRTSLSRVRIFSETLVKNMPIGLIALDNQDKIIACNEKAQVILGIVCSKASDKQDIQLLPDHLKKMLAELSSCGGFLERDVKHTFADGKEQIWETVAAGLIDEGTPIGKILLIRDVTDIRQMEDEVTRSRHLSSIGSLAAGVAHEIRNPLSSIKGFAVYFKERLSGNKEEEQTADVMIAETERLNRVISQLIEFAKPLELRKERVRLIELVRHAVKLIDADAKENKISIEVDVATDIPAVEVDSDKIKQVLLNIFLNALEAMKDGGNLRIGVERDTDNVAVTISDNGIGIEKTDLPRIYDPYFTSKPAGTGLGLAIVQKFMEAHGGRIKVESVTGKGTKVILFFPLNHIKN
jgi:two-component system sensor histidine kinase HydH